jgi:hypothetical protein
MTAVSGSLRCKCSGHLFLIFTGNFSTQRFKNEFRVKTLYSVTKYIKIITVFLQKNFQQLKTSTSHIYVLLVVVYLVTLSVVLRQDLGSLTSDKLRRKWQLPHFVSCYPDTCLKNLGKTTKISATMADTKPRLDLWSSRKRGSKF